MDVTTISALAAAGAAVGAFSVAGVQLYVGHRQSEAALKAAKRCPDERAKCRAAYGGSVSAELDRQSHRRAQRLPRNPDVGDRHSLSPDDHRKLTALWTRLELLLNPNEADAVSLLKLADAARQSETAAERDSNARNMVQLARNLVKTEWIRIQIELQ